MRVSTDATSSTRVPQRARVVPQVSPHETEQNSHGWTSGYSQGDSREDGPMSDPIVTHRTHSTGPRRIMGRVRRPLRRHASSQADDRSHLECVGWRTTLEYRENNHRDFDGVLTGVEQRWRGDAERFCLNGSVIAPLRCRSNAVRGVAEAASGSRGDGPRSGSARR